MKGSQKKSLRTSSAKTSTSTSKSSSHVNTGVRSLTTLVSMTKSLPNAGFTPNHSAHFSRPQTGSATSSQVKVTSAIPSSSLASRLFSSATLSADQSSGIAKGPRKHRAKVQINPDTFSFESPIGENPAPRTKKQRTAKAIVSHAQLTQPTEAPELSSIFDAMKELDPSGFTRAAAAGVLPSGAAASHAKGVTTSAAPTKKSTKKAAAVESLVDEPKVVNGKPSSSGTATKVAKKIEQATLAPPTGKALQAVGTSAAINAALEKLETGGRANAAIIPDDNVSAKLVIASKKQQQTQASALNNVDAAAAAVEPGLKPKRKRRTKVEMQLARAEEAAAAAAAAAQASVVPPTPVEEVSAPVKASKKSSKKAVSAEKKTPTAAAAAELVVPVKKAALVPPSTTTAVETRVENGITTVNGKILVDPTDIAGLTRALVFAITNDVRHKHETEQKHLMVKNQEQQQLLTQLLIQQQEHGELLRKQVDSLRQSGLPLSSSTESMFKTGSAISLAVDAPTTTAKTTRAKKSTKTVTKSANSITQSSFSSTRQGLVSGIRTQLHRRAAPATSSRAFSTTVHTNSEDDTMDERQRAEMILRDEYGIKFRFVNDNQLSIVNVPFAYGQPLKGVDRGPQDLRDNGLHDRIADEGFKIKDVTTIDVPEIDHEAFKSKDKHEDGTAKLKFPDLVSKVNEDTALATYESAKQRNFTLTIGGDHSIAIGSIAGLLKAKPDLGIIWVDAHSDINTPQTSNSGNIHGMVLSFLMKHKHSVDVPEYSWLTKYPKLNMNNFVYIGLRDLDKGEKMIIRTNNIKAFTMHDVDKYGIGKVMEMAVDHLTNHRRSDRPLHLSFDIDALDPDYAPATGTRVKGGLDYREAYYICEALAETGLLSSMDLVEVNSALASSPEESLRTIKMANGLIGSALGNRIL